MAKIFPGFIFDEENIQPGEKKVYYLLKNLLPDDFYVFHDVLILERYPDFIIMSSNIGLRILEVKDWSISYIKEANKKYFTLWNGKQEENPYDQAAQNMRNLSRLLGKEKSLLQVEGTHKGKLKFTRGCGVIFTNITKEDFSQINSNNAINNACVLFRDDIDALEKEENSTFLIEWLKNLYKRNLFKPLTQLEMELIKDNIYGVFHLQKVFTEKKNILSLLEEMQNDIRDIKKANKNIEIKVDHLYSSSKKHNYLSKKAKRIIKNKLSL